MDKKPICTVGCTIPKNWGKEFIIVNNEKYCAKLLIFKAGCKFSCHYHMIKQETWYVTKGSFRFTWINTEDASVQSKELEVGDIVTIPIGMPHQLYAHKDGEIFEISTQHFDSDSYRVWKGD